MFQESAIISAILLNKKVFEDEADRRAFYGPDAQPEVTQPRRSKVRTPRFLRRGSSLA